MLKIVLLNLLLHANILKIFASIVVNITIAYLVLMEYTIPSTHFFYSFISLGHLLQSTSPLAASNSYVYRIQVIMGGEIISMYHELRFSCCYQLKDFRNCQLKTLWYGIFRSYLVHH